MALELEFIVKFITIHFLANIIAACPFMKSKWTQ